MATRVTQEQEILKKAREEIQKKTGKAPEQLYEEREKRIMDAIALKEPDRVPTMLRLGYFPLRYAGLPQSVAFYDPVVHRQTIIKTLVDFEPDSYLAAANVNYSGLALEALDPKSYRWPGGTLASDITSQFLEGEYMKEDEYDLFMTDPTDFALRCYLPRVFGALEPFSKIPTLGQRLFGTVSGFLTMSPIFATPEFQKVAKAMFKAGEEEGKFSDWEQEIWDLGFPMTQYGTPLGQEPFDIFASYLRGLSGIVRDMFQQPEKLAAACERVLEWRLARAKPAEPKKRRIQVGSFHFNSDSFMGNKQYETFVWPTFKKLLLSAIDLGYFPTPFGEGKCDEKLEYFLQLPKGKIWFRATDVDMARAKAILGGHCCIAGNVPGSLLQVGSVQEVEEYCKNLIKVCGKGGGFILGCGNSLDEAKPANVKAMIDSAEKYGRY